MLEEKIQFQYVHPGLKILKHRPGRLTQANACAPPRSPQHSKESFLSLACIVSEEQKTLEITCITYINRRLFDEDIKVQFKTTN